MAITTTEHQALYQLMSWLSPSYPVSAYSFSHGLEWAIEDEPLTDAVGLGQWIETVLVHGSGRNDAILFAEAWRTCAQGDVERLAGCAELAFALAGSRERREEMRTQGRAFISTTLNVWPAPRLQQHGSMLGTAPPYPVAVATVAEAHDVPLEMALCAYLHAVAANLVSAGVRLIPLGQTDGQRLIAGLAETVRSVGADALEATLDDLGGCAILSDIAAMAHETQRTRLFRS